MRIIFILFAMLLSLTTARAQDDQSEADNGFLINLVQETLSSETRQIAFFGVEGALSSNATIERITVADTRGVWLEINQASLSWTRSALLLGRLNISEISIASVVVSRKPVAGDAPPDTLPDPAEGSFKLPELPVAVRITKAEIPDIRIGEAVFGTAVVLDFEAAMVLEDGNLDTQVAINRLDGSQGKLDLSAAFSNETEQLDVDLTLQEPPNGVLASLLKIENQPAIALEVKGSGPLSDFDAGLDLVAGGETLVSGEVRIEDADGGRGFSAALAGNLQPLIPADFREFFAGNSLISAQGLVPNSGGLRLDEVVIEGAALEVAGNALFGPDGFPNSASLIGKLGDPDGSATLLPVAGANTTLQTGEIDIQLGNTGAWTGEIRMDRLDTGEVLLGSIVLDMDATVANIDMPGQRHLDAALRASVEGIEADDPNIRQALGDRIEFVSQVSWSQSEPLNINGANLSGNGVEVMLEGQFSAGAFTGVVSADMADLTPLSGISGQALAGELSFAASGTVRPLTGGFDLQLTGDATDLALGNPQIDPLLSGQTSLRGGIARDADGIRTDRFQLANAQISIKADGSLSLAKTDLTIGADLSDIGLITDQVSGPVQVLADAKGGATGPIALEMRAILPDTRFMDHRLQAGRISINGDLQRNRDLSGSITGSAIFDGSQASLSGEIELTRAVKALREFSFVTDGTVLSGEIEQDTKGLLTGQLDLRAPDISTATALALQEATGAVYARIGLDHADGQQNLQTSAKISQLDVAGFELQSGEIEADLYDLFGIPLADGTVQLMNATFGDQGLTRLEASATRNGPGMVLKADANLLNGTFAVLGGTLDHLENGLRVLLSDLLLQQGDIEARLIGQSELKIVDDTIALSPLVLNIEEGELRLEGKIADNIELDFEGRDIPLSIANTISAGFGVGGTLDGTAVISGPRADPQINFRTSLNDVTAAILLQAGLPPLSLNMQGKTDRNALELDAALTSRTGIDARISGSVPISTEAGEMDLAVSLNELPLVFLNAVLPGQGIGGTVSGTAEISGPLNEPGASFQIAGQNLNATPLRQNGITGLQAELFGQYSSQTLTVGGAQVTGQQGLRLNAKGVVPLSGPGLEVNIDGLVPLALANTALSASSLQATGGLQLEGRVSGSLNQPAVSGAANMQDGVLIAPLMNLRLQKIVLSASLSERQFVLEQLRGDVAAGGRLEASGTVSLDAARGLPADLKLRLSRAVYSDGNILTTKVSSKLEITGPLLRRPLVSGDIDLAETNIVLPERFSISQGVLLDVEHLNPPKNVRMTLDRAGLSGSETTRPQGAGVDVQLDIQINSSDRIFIRGWGLDAEMGGDLLLRGPASDVSALGAFNMIRGRIAIAGKRLDFREGRLSFAGRLSPEVYFQTESQSGDYTVYLTISGQLPDPEIVFSASPDLPEDEALAQLLFSTPMDELSAFQIAQLAGAVSFLTGGGRPGLLDSVRAGLRLDNLDFTTDEAGETTVSAGKYIDENIYLDLEAQADGGTAATVTLDLTDDFKARGSMASDGESTLGIFFERDY